MRIIILLLLAFITSNCGKKNMSQKKPLNLSLSLPLSTLNPTTAGEYPGCYVVRMLFEGLTRLDEHGNTALGVAENYTVSEDFKTYTFMLRETFWSDRTPVTAYDFEYAWKKCLDPKTGSLGAHFLYVIKNARLAAQGKAPLSEVGVKALDPSTLEIELNHPVPYLLDLLGRYNGFFPIPKHLDEIDPSWIHRTDQTFVSNGPFKLKTWKQEDGITLEKNPSYWDQKHVFLPEIEWSFIGNGTTALYMYEKNQLDWIGAPLNSIPQEALETLRKQEGYSCTDNAQVNCFCLNNQVFPFHNKKMRQAFSYALDRTAIVDHILDGNTLPAYGVLSPFFALGNSPCFEDNKPDEAKRLFNEALLEEGLTLTTFPAMTIRYFTGYETFYQIAQIAQQVWQQTFGIKITLSAADWPAHFSALQRGDYQIATMKPNYALDPVCQLEIFKYKDDRVNLANWESQKYIDLLEASNYEMDLEKRRRILTAAEKVLMDEMAIIPIHFNKVEFSKNPRLTGVITSKDNLNFKFARFSQ